MGDKIKSAWEKAMERFEEKNKNVSDSDIMRMECLPEGQKLAGRFLAEPQFDLTAALEQYDNERQKLVLKALEDTLISRLVLPEDEQAMQDDRRVMEGLLQLKKDKETLSPLLKFQEEWTKLMGQLNEKFLPSFEQIRQRIKELN